MIRQIQLGKKGITDNFIESLKNQFKNSKNIKVSVLRSYCRDKEQLKKITEEILDRLGTNYRARTIGYTIALKKQKKSKL